MTSMKRLLLLLPLLALPSCDSPGKAAAAESVIQSPPAPPAVAVTAPLELTRSVVRINSTRQTWNDNQPWEKNPPNQRRALGPVVGPNLVLTTGELVGDATYLEFESTDGTRLTPAKVIAVDFEANLALLGPADDAAGAKFFEGMKPLEMDGSPKIGDPLDILQVEDNGVPLLTAGALQGVDVVSNFLEGQYFLTFQVKASMQSAASSFSLPVLSNGKLAGLLASYNSKDQLSDVIATELVKRFLESAKTGHYAGFPGLGLETTRTEDPSLRQWLKLGDDQGGIYVSGVRKGGSAQLAGVKKGDVVLAVGDHPIDRRGYYAHPVYGNLFWSHLIRGEKNVGDTITLKLLRDGQPLSLDVKLVRQEERDNLVPAYTFGNAPRYLVKGGLIFQELTKPLLESFGDEWQSRAPLNLLDAFENPEKYEGKMEHVVFLSGVIPTPATVGYERLRNLVVRKVDGQDVRDMKSLVAAFKQPSNGLHSIEFQDESLVVYLDDRVSEAVDRKLIQRGIGRLSRTE
jgi:S1-C subfamily serine protease